MFKFVVVGALLVCSLEQAWSGVLLGGHGGGVSLGGYSVDESYGSDHSGSFSPISFGGGDASSASLQQSGSGVGDYHGGVSVVGTGSSQQGQSFDLTDQGGHDAGIFGGSFVSADKGDDGSSGGHDGGSDSGYSGLSSYDVSHGSDGGETASLLSSSFKGADLGGSDYLGHWSG